MGADSKPKINGSAQAIPQPDRMRWKKNEGYYTIKSWRGTKAAIQTKCNECIAAGWDVEDMGPANGPTSVLWTLSVATSVAPGSDPNNVANVIDVWELDSTSSEKDVLLSDAPLINAIPDTQKNILSASIQNNDVSAPATLTDATAKRQWTLMRAGDRSVIVFAPFLIHTQIVSSQYTVKASLANVKRIITTNSMSSLEGLPNTLLFTLPADTSGITDLAYGWLKLYPRVSQAANNKWQIMQRYQYGLWSVISYQTTL